MQDSCITVQEKVVVPNIPVVEEEIICPQPQIQVQEKVVVPAIVQEVQRQYKLDPLWDSLEETPKNHIQMIVYKGRDEDYDVSFWFYDQNIRVDWGDGIIEDFVNSKAGLDRVNHKFVDGSGKLDSNGERFWFVDITIIKDNITYNTFNLSNYNNDRDYSKSIIKAVSINREGLYTNLIISDISQQYPPYVEYVRVHGNYIIFRNDNLSSKFIKEIRFDSNDIKFEKLIGNTFPNNYPGYPINVFNPELVGSYADALFSRAYTPILLKKSYDLRKFTFSSISSLFEGNDIVEEIYLPEQSSENWKSLGYMLSGCIRLRRLIFPKDQSLFSYINNLTSSFAQLYNLEEVENFPNEHIGEFSDEAIICTGFNFFKYSMGFGNDKIKLRCFIANDSYINSLQFSNESPFDYRGTHIDLLRAKFEKDSLLSLFNRLPDFTNSNSRTINIVDNPGTSELMEEDIKIATDKNWVVITK
ncbi:hypothetical protein KNV43_gp020 [uncultured phage cr128_1]|uniref:Uncharacterized protein n=1 Tax=uncultured phage cr128_1 TaxID=2772076 RepID=A0A7M1S0N3_9CAUD|nr:hypothetical protein KNV43_gp020 [uncultured phage cr128_1]QOR59732.1 hypothetical protein [uncultured phage cr128_1]DAQ75986.1 MAG TPA: hypothetical protein [Bacteriophage sp.]